MSWLRKLGTVLVAVLLITSGASAPAAATHECSNVDALVFGFSFGFVNEDRCTNNHVEDAVQEVRDAETAQDKVDLYTAATAQASQQEVYTSAVDNYLQDTDSIAWSKAEVAIAEAHEAGKTKAEAKIAARGAIADYYTVKQKNLAESYTSQIVSLGYIKDRASQEGFGTNTILNTQTENGIVTSNEAFPDNPASNNQTITFVNGTTGSAPQPQLAYRGGGGTFDSTLLLDESLTEHKNSFEGSISIIAVAPNSNYEDEVVLNATAYVSRWNQIETKNSELQSEAETFVDAIWSDLESGALDSSDVISRNTQLFEYGTAAQNDSAGFYDTVGATAALGLQAPDLAETSSMTVEYKGQTYNGLLFARNVPGGAWSVGQTYNTTNFDGPVILATVENGELVLDGEFTLTEARNKAGDPVGTVQTTRYNYQTADTSELNQQLDQLAELTGELQNRSDAAGGGGGGIGGAGSVLEDIGTALGFGAGVGLIVVLAVVAVAARVFTG
jgi:hypothetical protein